MLRKFFILYKKLIPHIIFLWLILLISLASIYAVFSVVRYYEQYLNEQISACQGVLYLDSRTNPATYQKELQQYSFIDRAKIDYNSQTLQKLEHNFKLHNIRKWLKTDKFPHILVFYLNGENFSLLKFQQLVKKFSEDINIKKIDFNTDKIIELSKRREQLINYVNMPFYTILFVTIVLIFLITRLMRYKRKQLWAQWRAIEKGNTNKIYHAILEFILSAIVLFAIFILPNQQWGAAFLQEFHIRLLSTPEIWYWLGAVFLVYIIISIINIVELPRKTR